jgi:hypothetical protein
MVPADGTVGAAAAAAAANAGVGDQTNVQVRGSNAGGNPGGKNPGEAYLATFFTGQLPAAIGEVAKAVAAKQSLEEQREKAETMFQFLQNDTSDLRDLNSTRKRRRSGIGKFEKPMNQQ